MNNDHRCRRVCLELYSNSKKHSRTVFDFLKFSKGYEMDFKLGVPLYPVLSVHLLVHYWYVSWLESWSLVKLVLL